MLKPAGMRIRKSLAAVMLGVAASVTVIVLIAVIGSPTVKLWFAAEESVGWLMVMVFESVAAVPPPAPERTSCRVLAAEGAVKFAKLRPATVSWSPAAKSVVTFRTNDFAAGDQLTVA